METGRLKLLIGNKTEILEDSEVGIEDLDNVG